MIEIVSIVCGVVAVAGVVLNNHRRRSCFLLWLVSNGLSAGIHATAGLWSLAARDVIFFVLAVHGYWCWGRKL